MNNLFALENTPTAFYFRNSTIQLSYDAQFESFGLKGPHLYIRSIKQLISELMMAALQTLKQNWRNWRTQKCHPNTSLVTDKMQAAKIRPLEIKTVEAGSMPRYRKRANTLYPQPGD